MADSVRGAPAVLALEDGTVFRGRAFGAGGETFGEVVFNTSMTGYQEILTDPSYKGQIVTMTYPLIGNYGVNSLDVESAGPQAAGFVIRELSALRSNYRSEMDLDQYLNQTGVLGVEGVDTRALTKHIRTRGAMRGVMSSVDLDADSLVDKARSSPSLVGRDLVREVTCAEAYEWTEPEPRIFGEAAPAADNAFHVVVVDCGVKRNILRCLAGRGLRVTVTPASTPAERILAHKPDGVLFSNGPGDPEGAPYVFQTARELTGKTPLFGICLGHQMMGLAWGGKTYKLKFGHRGSNQPVMDLGPRKVAITCQNHGFAVQMDSLPPNEVEQTHINLNDQTCEGMRRLDRSAFSVQYHPEASAGPKDAGYLFDEFVKMMERWKNA